MKTEKNVFYENYPLADVAACNIVSLGIYAAGALILARIGFEWVALYLLYCLVLEIQLIGRHCRDCYYYARCCAFGKGKLASLFFKCGSGRFDALRITWATVAPGFLVALIPAIAGAIMLLKSFDWVVAALVAAILALASLGSAFVRRKIACAHCKQRELGCPAEKLFDQNKSKGKTKAKNEL